ncbi:MAG: DNA topoisomerase I [Pelagibacteraceae bacterium]|nr:DNA topoisomerase I [Pelagibacteraceae bacterium]|tara:strand:- start:1355 stop:3865 length:2511 start_codon:yes stop_codon:yes gene_type:complete
MNLLIVESPAKAKTINKYLGDDFDVIATVGHFRDLAKKNGVVVTEDYKDVVLNWETTSAGEKLIENIRNKSSKYEKIYLATDPDREGEAITWHLISSLEKDIDAGKFKRITFNEITKKAVLLSFDNAREVDSDLVSAYMARRSLDYLAGYNLSPVLWRKMPGSRSAGRVQSVAVRLIYEKEIEIENFEPDRFFKIHINGKINNQAIETTLTEYEGDKIDKMFFKDENKAKSAVSAIKNNTYTINAVDERNVSRKPKSPFNTSALQQTANSQINFSASQTMTVAQGLYMGIDIGSETIALITYMRTDSISLSNDSINLIRDKIITEYGENYLPKDPIIYKTKKKNAQEAHEAIRPTDINIHPNSIKESLTEEQFKLYDLIWRRTISSQMVNAETKLSTIRINSKDNNVHLKATIGKLTFEGFKKAYNLQEEDEEKFALLDSVKIGDPFGIDSIESIESFTSPPSRYTDASLVKKLEELDIGRPSTYASIIQTIVSRGYVLKNGKAFLLNDRGRVVNVFLCNYFRKFLEYKFTADLESQLDDVAASKAEWKNIVLDFWKDFEFFINEVMGKPNREVIDVINDELSPVIFKKIGGEIDIKCSSWANTKECDGDLGIKVGKMGGFIGCSNYPDCKYTVSIGAFIKEINPKNREGEDIVVFPRILGKEADSGKDISVHLGPYGYYLQLGTDQDEEKPKRVTLTKNYDAINIGMNIASQLIKLPKKLGLYPNSEDEIIANIGAYGPYVKYKDIFASLGKKYDVLEIGIEQAIELINIKKNKPTNKVREIGVLKKRRQKANLYKGKSGKYYFKIGIMNYKIPPEIDGENITIKDVEGILKSSR